MSASAQTQDFSWFKQNSSIHGVSEVASSQKKIQKAIWCTAILLALTGLIYQFAGITTSYMRDDTGSRDLAYHATKLPAVMVCPTRLHLVDDVSEEDNLYMKGFFPFLDHEILHGVPRLTGVSPNAKVDLTLARKYNGSVPAMLFDLLKQPLLKRWASIPPIAMVRESPINTGYGTCFLVWSEMEVTDRLAEYAEYIFTLPVGDEMYGTPFPFRLFLGGEESVGVAPSMSEVIPLYRRVKYHLSVRVYERRSYPGRLGTQCKPDHTQSLYRYCVLKYAAEECVRSISQCLVYTPRVAGETDLTDYRDTTFCNTKRNGSVVCLFQLYLDGDNRGGMLDRCPMPCTEYAYDKSVASQSLVGNDTEVQVSVKLDSLAMSKVTVEYPLMTTVDYFAAVGGTAGLFFGSSVLSCVQILVCLVGEASRGKRLLGKIGSGGMDVEAGQP